MSNIFRRNTHKRALFISVSVASVIGLASGCSSKDGPPAEGAGPAIAASIEAKVSSAVTVALQTHERTRVLVSLKENGFLDRISKLNNVHITHTWKHVTGFAAELDRAGLEAVAADPNVEQIQVDEVRHAQLAESLPLVRADRAHRTGHTGNGQKVVV